MMVVEVIPIVRGIQRATLTYFTKESVPLGSFVRIPVRSGYSTGLVVDAKSVRSMKASIKSADFSLKKVATLKSIGSLSPAFVKASEDTAKYFATTTGSVMASILPKILLEHPHLIGKPIKQKILGIKETKLIQLSREERMREYRGVVRESFAKKSSVLFVVPTREDVKQLKEELSLGIENFVYTPTEVTSGSIKKILEKFHNERHPILLITTPSFIPLFRKDIKTIVVEKENSKGYKGLSRPYIDIKHFLSAYARHLGATLILGDSVLSLESLWHEREGRYSELSPLTWRLKYQASTEVIDMRAKKEFQVFSDRLVEILGRALQNKKKIILFGVRKGLSSTTVCGDCASLLLCKNCKAPLVLYKETYLCHHCGAKRATETRCDNCQSWKLHPLGIGIDRIAEACQELFPDIETVVVDKEHTTTKKQVLDKIKKFETTPNTILIGTELALQNLKEAHITVAVSMDTLFSIPNFHINEKIFYLITKLREISKESFVIQTRNANTDILEYAAAGNILDFYRTEIKDREDLYYPPFSLFIKVTTEDKPVNIETKAVMLKKLFLDNNPHFILEDRREKGANRLSMVMRLNRETWPDQEVLDKLLLLTPDFLIKVEPESVF